MESSEIMQWNTYISLKAQHTWFATSTGWQTEQQSCHGYHIHILPKSSQSIHSESKEKLELFPEAQVWIKTATN